MFVETVIITRRNIHGKIGVGVFLSKSSSNVNLLVFTQTCEYYKCHEWLPVKDLHIIFRGILPLLM